MRRKLTRSRYCRDLGKQAATPHTTRSKKHTHAPGIVQYCAKKDLPNITIRQYTFKVKPISSHNLMIYIRKMYLVLSYQRTNVGSQTSWAARGVQLNRQITLRLLNLPVQGTRMYYMSNGSISLWLDDVTEFGQCCDGVLKSSQTTQSQHQVNFL